MTETTKPQMGLPDDPWYATEAKSGLPPSGEGKITISPNDTFFSTLQRFK